MRRRAILAAAPALVAAPYVARAQTGKPEKTKVVLAVGGKSALYYLSLTIAETKGYFKDAGLDVEINDFQGGAKSLEALMGGSADVVAGAYEHTIRMQQRGQPIKGFALIGRGMQIAIGLRNDVAAKVKGPADIKGMKFGVTAPGSSTHMLVQQLGGQGRPQGHRRRRHRRRRRRLGRGGDREGPVDGISQTDPALTILQDKGLIKIMVDTRTMKGNQELFGGAYAGGLPLRPAGAPDQDAEHRAGARQRRSCAPTSGCRRRRRPTSPRRCPRATCWATARSTRSAFANVRETHLARRHDAGRAVRTTA